jgi:hypothetical protein
MSTKRSVLTLSLFGPLIVLLGLIIGLDAVRSHPTDGAISLPKCSQSSMSPSDPSMTLTASLPQPMATVLVGHHLVVVVPRGVGFFHIVNDKALRSVCASVLPDHSTEVVVTAVASGESNIGGEAAGLGGHVAVPYFGARVEVRRSLPSF